MKNYEDDELMGNPDNKLLQDAFKKIKQAGIPSKMIELMIKEISKTDKELASISKDKIGKYFIFKKYPSYDSSKYKCYGKLVKVHINWSANWSGAASDFLYTPLALTYENKKHEIKTLTISYFLSADIRFYDTEEEARLAAKLLD